MSKSDEGPPRDDAPPPEHENESAPPRPTGDATALMHRPAGTPAPIEAGAQALSAQVESTIKAKYFLAKQFPRDWMVVRHNLLKAFERPMLAEGAIYAKPIGGKNAEGLSIRFAEEAFRAMGNVDVSTLLVSDDDDKRVYLVTGMDLETNASIPVPVVVTKQMERASLKPGDVVLHERMNSRNVKTYVIKARSEDDYRSKEQALLQKARRDVIIFLTPGDIREECEAQIRTTLQDRDKKDLKGAIKRMTEAFYSFGITTAELEKYMGHPVDLTNAGELQVFRKNLTSLKEGEATWAELVEQKLATNTGADAKAGDPVAATGTPKGATAKVAQAISAIPPRIQKMLDNETVPNALNDEDKEELRQYRTDHPDLFKK